MRLLLSSTLNTSRNLFLINIIIFYVNFNRAWTDGDFDKVDPYAVEQDIGNYWRQLYKLEKTFAENPNARTISQKVK